MTSYSICESDLDRKKIQIYTLSGYPKLSGCTKSMNILRNLNGNLLSHIYHKNREENKFYKNMNITKKINTHILLDNAATIKREKNKYYCFMLMICSLDRINILVI